MRNKPPYAITSVDHALQLAALLQQEGALRVTDAAERLGVSASTAHRLLSMLVYRDFAEQNEDRSYRPGKILRPAETSGAPVALLRRIALPHLARLRDTTGETVNLMVLAGTEVRFVATVESDQVLRVGDRVGRSLPARLTSGGKAILAAQPPSAGHPEPLRRELAAVRRRGYAINDQQTEAGLTALGRAVTDPAGNPVAAVSLALPTARFRKAELPGWAAALVTATTAIEHDLAGSGA